MTGDENALQRCENALCINTVSNKKTRIALDIPAKPDAWVGVDQLVFEAYITNASDTLRNEQTVNSPSYIVARARSSDGKNLRNLGSVISLDNHPKKQLHRRISSFHTQTAHLQIVVSIQGATAIKIEKFRFYTVKLSKKYLVARAVIFSGWVGMMLLLAFSVLSQFTRTIQVICTLGFTLMLVIGASHLGSMLTRHLSGIFEANWYQHLAIVASFSNNVSLTAVHLFFHLLCTLLLGSFSQALKFSYWHLFALNLSIAIAVECAQMGIPERSADVNDLVAALLGTVVGVALLVIINTITRCRKQHLHGNHSSFR